MTQPATSSSTTPTGSSSTVGTGATGSFNPGQGTNQSSSSLFTGPGAGVSQQPTPTSTPALFPTGSPNTTQQAQTVGSFTQSGKNGSGASGGQVGAGSGSSSPGQDPYTRLTGAPLPAVASPTVNTGAAPTPVQTPVAGPGTGMVTEEQMMRQVSPYYSALRDAGFTHEAAKYVSEANEQQAIQSFP